MSIIKDSSAEKALVGKAPLRIKTFTDQGVSCFFKALGHLEIQPKLQAMISLIKSSKDIAVYDPENKLEEFIDLTDIKVDDFSEIYVQKLELADHKYDSKEVRLISDLPHSEASKLLILAFDAQKYQDHIKHLNSRKAEIITLDQLKLPDHMITNRNHYLDRLNWTTNFMWIKEIDGIHTRLTSANCWVKYGAKNLSAYMYLMDHSGKILAHWHEPLNDKLDILILDSKKIKERFLLPEFIGQIFVHIVGTTGHDVMKYALDIYGDSNDILSATHDANPWPARYFAGLPAPKANEQVLLWLQNTHPIFAKPGSISINIMGEKETQYIKDEIPPYGSLSVNLADYFPDTLFPMQFEIDAGNYCVRPRYEVKNLDTKRGCIAHVNVERDSLEVDYNIKDITKFIGKGYILPSPILPINKFTIQVLPTPMSRSIQHLPLKAIVYSNTGEELAVHKFGNLPRNHKQFLSVNELVQNIEFFKQPSAYGNLQLVYDFEVGSEADGWIHSIFKYYDKDTGHSAETSFGGHIFNNITTYKSEPQSYKGPPPGLSTWLFLRVGTEGRNTLSYLIYPISKYWHAKSNTTITLFDNGDEIARHHIEIDANGCYLLDCYKIFSKEVIEKLNKPYISILDKTCRLFGYHLLTTENAFSLDHMFGF